MNLGVDSATVSRTVARFRETGGVKKKDHPSTRAYGKLTTALEFTLVLKHPWDISSRDRFRTTGYYRGRCLTVHHLQISKENWVYQANTKTGSSPKR